MAFQTTEKNAFVKQIPSEVHLTLSISHIANMSWQILGVLDFGRDAWIHREDWIRNGIHIASGRKYKDSYYLQAQAMCYMNS